MEICATLSRGPQETPPLYILLSSIHSGRRLFFILPTIYSKSPKDVQRNITSVLQFPCKDRCVCDLKLPSEENLFTRCCTDAQCKASPSPTVFLYRAPRPAREKHHSQLLRMQSIKSNLLTSSIACMSEQGGHLWKKTKWLHAHNRPDGDIRFCGANTHTNVSCYKLYTHCEGRTKVLWWVAVAVELHGVYQKPIDYINKWKNVGLRGSSWACLQPIVSFLGWAETDTCDRLGYGWVHLMLYKFILHFRDTVSQVTFHGKE